MLEFNYNNIFYHLSRNEFFVVLKSTFDTCEIFLLNCKRSKIKFNGMKQVNCELDEDIPLFIAVIGHVISIIHRFKI